MSVKGSASQGARSKGAMHTPHVCGKVAQDVIEGHLVEEHLVPDLVRGKVSESLVSPCVAGNLVALGNHSLVTCV